MPGLGLCTICLWDHLTESNPGAPPHPQKLFLAPLRMSRHLLWMYIWNQVANFCLPPPHAPNHKQLEYAALIYDCQELANCAEYILEVFATHLSSKRLNLVNTSGHVIRRKDQLNLSCCSLCSKMCAIAQASPRPCTDLRYYYKKTIPKVTVMVQIQLRSRTSVIYRDLKMDSLPPPSSCH